jgi:hypothetical protein
MVSDGRNGLEDRDAGIESSSVRKFVCFAVAAVFCLNAFSGEKKAVPRFTDYPATNVFKGKPVKVDLKSDPQARRFRTQLRTQTAEGADFAGHYRLVIWGCGTGCQEFAIVDCKSGKVHFSSELPYVTYGAVDRDDFGLEFRVNSRLLIVRGARKEGADGVYYYLWDGKKVTLIAEEPTKPKE